MARHKMRMPDVKRMGVAMRQPGIDTRVWAVAGRVVEEDGAIRWDRNIGWIIDLDTMGALYGGEVRARVGGADKYEYLPIDDDSEWVISIPDGDASMNPVAVARLSNDSTCKAPSTVGNIAVDGSITKTLIPIDSKLGVFSPYDTEFKHSPHHRREQYDGDYMLSAEHSILEGDKITLGSRDAEQSFVRGEEFSEAVTAAVESLIITCLGNLGAPISLPPTWAVTDRLLFKQKMLDALSEVIKGK